MGNCRKSGELSYYVKDNHRREIYMRRSLEKQLDTLLIEAQKTGTDSIVYLDEKTGNVWVYTTERGVWFRAR